MQTSIGEKFQKNINKCDICFGNYDRTSHAPVIICSMHHTICKACMDALRVKPQCPFCRETVRMDKIVVNNYIFELLPGEGPAPDVSVQPQHLPPRPQQIHYSQVIYPGNQPYPPPPQHFQPQLEANQGQYMSVNRMDNPPAYQPEEYEPDYDSDMESASIGICIAMCLQIPFTFMNFFMAKGNYGSCTDYGYDKVVRPWYLAIGSVELVLIAALLFGYLIRKCHCISADCFRAWLIVLGVLAFVKLMVWSIAQVNLFSKIIAPTCTQAAYGYGLFLTILHGIFLMVLFCFGSCSRRY